jgi:hypothetical protein
LSKHSWVIGYVTPLSARIRRRILSGGDWKGLLELIEEVRARVSREMGRPVEVMSCYEAGYGRTGSSKRMGCAITLLIRQACRWIGDCDE